MRVRSSVLKRISPTQWTPAAAAHLLNRAGFGGTPAEVAAFHARGLNGAVEWLLAGTDEDDLFPPPVLEEPSVTLERMRTARASNDDDVRKAAQRQSRRIQNQEIQLVRAWWLNRMRYTPFPLREKLTLFWHGHFATSTQKVRSTYLMWQQNETLRAHALGNFGTLVKEISRDPAMMRYLDLTDSKRGKPNENFARELMELFTLGEGEGYTEEDIAESARAFTGYRMDPRTGGFLRVQRNFDASEKSFMGREGTFDGDAVIDIILEQPACAQFIAGKLWVFFAAENPSPALVQNLGANLRGSKYDLRSTLREMFLSEAFYEPSVVRSQVKSPVQWMIQTARTLEAPLPSQAAMEVSLAQLGQVPFDPPSVKGWEGGRAWISSSTLLLRYNLAGYIVSGKASELSGFRKGSGVVDVPLEKIAPPDLRGDPEVLCDAISWRLLNARFEGKDRTRLVAFLQAQGDEINEPALRDFLHLMMSTPEYQLT